MGIFVGGWKCNNCGKYKSGGFYCCDGCGLVFCNDCKDLMKIHESAICLCSKCYSPTKINDIVLNLLRENQDMANKILKIRWILEK